MTVVGPNTATQVPVVYDSDNNGFGGPADMAGPEIGQVIYSQPGDNLQVQINLDFGQPNTTYQVFLVCGPAHALGCGFTVIGTLTTDATGAGTTGITVAVAVLQAAPYGPGYRNRPYRPVARLRGPQPGLLDSRRDQLLRMHERRNTTASPA